MCLGIAYAKPRQPVRVWPLTVPVLNFSREEMASEISPHIFRLTKHGLQANTSQGMQLAHLVDTIDQRLGAIFPTSHCHKGGLSA